MVPLDQVLHLAPLLPLAVDLALALWAAQQMAVMVALVAVVVELAPEQAALAILLTLHHLKGTMAGTEAETRVAEAAVLPQRDQPLAH